MAANRNVRTVALLGVAAVFVGISTLMSVVAVGSPAIEWEVINPEGVVAVKPVQLPPRLQTLEGKTILLRWNGKPNGDVVLKRIAERLMQETPSARVIKLYEEEPASAEYGKTVEKAAADMQAAVKRYKPDLVIASQAD